MKFVNDVSLLYSGEQCSSKTSFTLQTQKLMFLFNNIYEVHLLNNSEGWNCKWWPYFGICLETDYYWWWAWQESWILPKHTTRVQTQCHSEQSDWPNIHITYYKFFI